MGQVRASKHDGNQLNSLAEQEDKEYIAHKLAEDPTTNQVMANNHRSL
jgi:hypothetical protein